MRQRRFRRFVSSISTLRSALIAGPANLFVPFEAIFENDALPEKWKHYAQINADYYKERERIEICFQFAKQNVWRIWGKLKSKRREKGK
jgi:hypothetical protein